MTRETKLIIIFMALAALFVYSAMSAAVWSGQRRAEQRIQQIEERFKETSETINQIKKEKVTTETIKKTIETLPIDYRQRVKEYKYITADRRGGNWIDRINSRLAGTPMAGMGRQFVISAADYGLPPNLSVAIAGHESGFGRWTPPGSLNPFGMTKGTAPGYAAVSARGPDGVRGYQAFPDWSTAIKEHARFIRRTWGPVQSAYAMRGYAADGAWAGAVERVRASI